MSNENLHKAKRDANDEFYTRYEDIEKELSNYQDGQLRGKWVYCPCDNWNKSNFPKYFKENFARIGLKRLTCSCWNPNGPSKMWDYDGIRVLEYELGGNGDFRSEECTKIKDVCDIVITNPPFSLFRDFIYWLNDGKFNLNSDGMYERVKDGEPPLH